MAMQGAIAIEVPSTCIRARVTGQKPKVRTHVLRRNLILPGCQDRAWGCPDGCCSAAVTVTHLPRWAHVYSLRAAAHAEVPYAAGAQGACGVMQASLGMRCNSW